MTSTDTPLAKEQIAFGAPLPTAEEAAEAGRMGWNLRCNHCGLYGAAWIPKMRPGWGSLALCYPHKAELEATQRRHAEELRALTAVRYEQPR
jgi:hypothetical protein